MLDRGDDAVLAAPVSDFYQELDLMRLGPPAFHANIATNTFADETMNAEIGDLRAALKKFDVPGDESEKIIAQHLAARAKLDAFDEELDRWRDSAPEDWIDGELRRGKPTTPQPAFPALSPVEKLPEEFADYFDGVMQWRNPAVADKQFARDAWERILARPADERRYKSVWAAFMLGKSWETEDPKKAAEFFQKARDLAKHGCVDSAGLAVASLGLEARVALRLGDFTNAIHLYLEQYGAGDYSAPDSLKVSAARALTAGATAIRGLAADDRARQVMTAYIVAHAAHTDWDDSHVNDLIRYWLVAVDSAGVRDAESAEKLALVAYQADQFALAQHWVDLAGNTPTAQWIQAKLWLRRGKVAPAMALLAQAINDFPMAIQEDTNAPTDFGGTLTVGLNPAGRYIRGELGALNVARGAYEPGLDLLLRSGYWRDAAYVAERVLTTDELRDYVDRNWAAAEASTTNVDSESESAISPGRLQREIRYLLARRLTRENRSTDARPYYPPEDTELTANFDAMIGGLRTGWDETLPADQRATALFTAAGIARTNGLELLGTETAPDWFMWGGGGSDESAGEEIRTNNEPRILRASARERRLAQEHVPDPNVRFHYRYQAAFLAWEATKLMPNNSDDTARVLYTAGTWLKYLDPPTADIFYKSLVRRCRNTTLGDAADKRRWFPSVDENWNLIVPKPTELEEPAESAAQPDQDTNAESSTTNSVETVDPPPLMGQSPAATSDAPPKTMIYVVAPGDTLISIQHKFHSDGIWEANPGIVWRQLRVGYHLVVPVPSRPSAEPQNE